MIENKAVTEKEGERYRKKEKERQVFVFKEIYRLPTTFR